MPVSEYNPLIEFVINTTPGVDLNNATSIIVHIIIGNSVVLKFKKGNPSGYDGDVDINGLSPNKCSVVATPSQAEAIKVGDLKAEIEIRIPFPGYPSGRKIKAVASLQKITFATTIK